MRTVPWVARRGSRAAGPDRAPMSLPRRCPSMSLSGLRDSPTHQGVRIRSSSCGPPRSQSPPGSLSLSRGLRAAAAVSLNRIVKGFNALQPTTGAERWLSSCMPVRSTASSLGSRDLVQRFSLCPPSAGALERKPRHAMQPLRLPPLRHRPLQCDWPVRRVRTLFSAVPVGPLQLLREANARVLSRQLRIISRDRRRRRA